MSDDEWAFVAPYLTLMKEDAPQREHSLREVFNGLRYVALPAQRPAALVHGLSADKALGRSGGVRNAGAGPETADAVFDARTLQATPESGGRAGFDGHKKRQGSTVHLAVDRLGQLLAAHVTPANEQERAQVAAIR